MARVIDMTGKQFGEWTVLKRAGSDKRGKLYGNANVLVAQLN